MPQQAGDISTIVKVNKNFSATKGDSFGIVILKFFTKLLDGTRVPSDLTGDIFSLIAVLPDDSPILTFAMNNGFTVQNTNELVMIKSDTAMNIAEGTYPYKFKRTHAGLTKTIAVGFFIIKP